MSVLSNVIIQAGGFVSENPGSSIVAAIDNAGIVQPVVSWNPATGVLGIVAPPGSNAGAPHTIAVDSPLISGSNALVSVVPSALHTLGASISHAVSTAAHWGSIVAQLQGTDGNIISQLLPISSYALVTGAALGSGIFGAAWAFTGTVECNMTAGGFQAVAQMSPFVGKILNTAGSITAAIFFQVAGNPGGAGSIVNLTGFLCPVLSSGSSTNRPIDCTSSFLADYATTAGQLRCMIGDNGGTMQRLKFGSAGTGPGGVGKAVYI